MNASRKRPKKRRCSAEVSRRLWQSLTVGTIGLQGWKRRDITEGKQNAFIAWVNSELLPYLHKLEKHPNATPRQKVISEVMSGVKQVRVDTDKNFLDVLDKVHLISEQN